MLPTTLDAWQAILRADPTVTAPQRRELVALVRNHGAEATSRAKAATPTDRILSRQEARDRFFPGKSLRFLDKLAQERVLKRVVLPGRTRAAGFSEADLVRLVEGGES